MASALSYVFLGLSITSSWGNGHATTYRGLLRELATRGHEVLFLERDLPFYRANRDLPKPAFGTTRLYDTVEDLFERYAAEIREADFVVIGSYVPDGIEVAERVLASRRKNVAFYDIDTPVTLQGLRDGTTAYLSKELVSRFDLYFSFTGGPVLRTLETEYGAKRARALYCGVDPELYFPEKRSIEYELGYLGTYSEDRQSSLNRLLLDTARIRPEKHFIVAGAQYPDGISFPPNVKHVVHLPPGKHRAFYGSQRFTLNVTREAMRRLGFSPSVRLFEAAACGTPILSDTWPGIETFFEPGREILLVNGTEDVLRILDTMSEAERVAMGKRARERVLREHTSAHRAETFERLTRQALEAR